METCGNCTGKGNVKIGTKTCLNCLGKGENIVKHVDGSISIKTCRRCSGSSEVDLMVTCTVCGGKGTV